MKNNKQFGLTDSLLDAVRQVMEKKLDPVGQADADIDNDGDVDSSDKYLHRRRKAIKKAMVTKEAMQMKRSKSDKDLAKEIEAYAKKHGGIDKASFMKAAQMLAKGQRSNAIKFAKKLDTDPRDWLLGKLDEAVSPAQQAAIAIAKKKAGTKPKNEGAMSRMASGGGLKTFKPKPKDPVDVKPQMKEASELPKK